MSMDDAVAKDLLAFFRKTAAYDIVGLLTGDPTKVAVPPVGFDDWGAVFLQDKDLIQAKYIKEGWLTPAEMEQLEVWDSQTDWMNRVAGRVLTRQEKASYLLEATTSAAIAIIGGRGGTGGPEIKLTASLVILRGFLALLKHLTRGLP